MHSNKTRETLHYLDGLADMQAEFCNIRCAIMRLHHSHSSFGHLLNEESFTHVYSHVLPFESIFIYVHVDVDVDVIILC